MGGLAGGIGSWHRIQRDADKKGEVTEQIEPSLTGRKAANLPPDSISF